MIKVKNDWTWVVERVNRELNGNTELEEKVYQYMDEKNIDLDRVKEMYQDGIEHGEENGKYLTFENWFNEFTN